MNPDLLFSLNPDVRSASTPPAAFYQSGDVYQQLLRQAFVPSWQVLGSTKMLPSPGAVTPLTLLPGSLDEPLLLTCDAQHQHHCLSNVCTHRGAIICAQPTRCDELRCPYHSRRFHLDGRMRFAPGFAEASDFPNSECDLPSLPLHARDPLLWTSLGAVDGLDRWLEPVMRRVGWLPLQQFTVDAGRCRDYEFAGNWMLYVENYLDSLHIPFAHPGLNQALDFSRYSTELFANGSLQLAIAAADEAAFEPPVQAPDHGLRVAAWYFWLFPNLMLNFYPWGLSLNIVEPQGVTHTRVRFMSFVWREQWLQDGAGAALHTVEMEDEALVLSVTRGMRSRLYRRGRYAPVHEAACHHFHQLLLQNLANT